MPGSKVATLVRGAGNRRKEDRIFRLEGWIIAALIGITGCLGNYTLNNINNNSHDTAEQVKQISKDVSDMNVRIIVLTSNVDTVTRRIDHDEKTRHEQ